MDNKALTQLGRCCEVSHLENGNYAGNGGIMMRLGKFEFLRRDNCQESRATIAEEALYI